MSSPPTTLGQYQIIREIARSNDIVYEAYDPLMNRRVAVKELMMPHGSTGQQQDDRISRFKREAQAAGTLNHPNIMTVYSFAEDAGRTFMAMEYLDGQTLRNDIDIKGTIPTDRAVEIAAAVLSGLEHAHSKGVIHRDIKPDNIQVLSTGAVKITDFGIARLTFQPNLTIDGQVFGTPSYMSPEQVVGRDIDARSDLFSVGVMLYEMLTGKKPFAGDSVVSITYAIMNAEPERPQNVQWPLWSVIEKALSKSPAMRYQSADEMKDALYEALSPNAGVLPVNDPYAPSAYSVNPYANPNLNPTPPPQIPAGNPYAAPNQQGIIQAPYNPYSAPGPNANPYAGQYQTSQPATYPYNPFMSPSGGASAPHTPGGMVAPIYYPPVPKLPLLKPETSLFLRKLILSLLIIGTLAALLVIGLQVVIGLSQKTTSTRERVEQSQIDSQKADDARKKGQTAVSEYYGSEAEQNNPHDPVISGKLAANYWDEAQKSTDFGGQSDLYYQSAIQYKQSADDQAEVNEHRSASVNYASAALNAASAAVQSRDSVRIRKMRTELESARTYVSGDHGDPELVQKIDDLLDQMRA